MLLSQETESANRLSPLAKKLIAIGVAVFLFIIGSSIFLLSKVEEATKESVELAGFFEASSAAFDPKLQSHLLNAELSYMEARKCQANKDYEGMHKAYTEAVNSFIACIGAKSAFTFAILMDQGRAECDFRKWSAAEDVFRRAIEGQSVDFKKNQERVFKARFWLAYALRNQRKFDPALELLTETLKEAEEYDKGKRDPVNLRMAVEELAHLYYQGGRYNDAEKQYLRVLSLREKRAPQEVAEALRWLANTKSGQEQFDHAIAYCNRAIALEGKNARNYICRAGIYSDAEQLDKSLADYNTAIEIKPGSGFVYESRGDTYLAMNNRQKAIEDYTKAISLSSDNKSASGKRAKLLEELGKAEPPE